jgi:hypothetical protein
VPQRSLAPLNFVEAIMRTFLLLSFLCIGDALKLSANSDSMNLDVDQKPHGQPGGIIQGHFPNPEIFRGRKGKVDLNFGLDCPNPSHPKLAICIAGQAREFLHANSREQFVTNVLNRLTETGAVGIARAEPDVFVHVKTGHMSDLQAAASGVRATASNVIETDFQEQLYSEGADCINTNGRPLRGIASYFKSYYDCKEMLKATEAAHNMKYDHVMVTRPDWFWSEQELSKEEGDNANFTMFKRSGYGDPALPNKIQCSKSMFYKDMMSFQTRETFEHVGNIWQDQFMAKRPSICDMDMPKLGYKWGDENLMQYTLILENQKHPDSCLYID